MARVEIDFPALFVNPSTQAVTAATSASVQVNARNTDATSGAAATVFSGPTGGATVANPMTPDAAGRLEGWLEPGRYNFVISGSGVTTYTQPWDASPNTQEATSLASAGTLTL